MSFVTVTDEDTVKRYYAKFEEKFFQTCEKELAKINTFYSGNYNNLTLHSSAGYFSMPHYLKTSFFFNHHQKSWLRLSGGLPPCRMNCSPRWTPKGRAWPVGGASGGGGLCLPCHRRSDANTGTYKTCSWPFLSSTLASFCSKTTR